MRIHIRQTDDWIAVYKDGKAVYQGHSCSLVRGLDALGITFTDDWIKPEDDSFPKILEETWCGTAR